MNASRVKMLLVCLNLPQIAASLAQGIYAIWFDDYAWRGVGPGVIYGAYALLIIAASQLVNLIAWFSMRKQPANAKLVLRIAGCALMLVVFFLWIGIHFEYAGSGKTPD